MEEFVGLLGWITAVSFGLTFTNYLVKIIYRHFISKLRDNMEWLVKPYRAVMRLIVKYHRWFGIVTFLSVITHFSLAAKFEGIPVTGIAAGSFMLILVGLGLYGYFIRKNRKGVWLILHRLTAFALILLVILHIASMG